MQTKEILVKNLSHIFTNFEGEKFYALKNVNATFNKASIVAIIGPSGSGKSVFLKHLNGLLIPSMGEIKIGDNTIWANQKKIKNIKEIRKKIGFVFEFAEKQLFETTVEKDIIFGPLNFNFSKKWAKQKALEYLNFFHLDTSYLKSSPFELSGGQKRKVAIAGILAYEPDFILFDQLVAGFDAAIKNEFFQLLFKLKEKNKTIIFTTNNPDDVLKIADQVIVLNQGQVVTITDPAKLFLNFPLCKANNIVLPKTLQFLQKLKAYGFSFNFTDLNFYNEETLIKDLVNYFIKLKVNGKINRNEN